jgi:hypothetical protein
MSLGERLRGMLDPLHPAVRAWLQRELPRLVQDGTISVTQADRIARRYGVTVTNADIAAATAPASPDLAAMPVASPAAAGLLAAPEIGETDGTATPVAAPLPDPVVGTIGGPASSAPAVQPPPPGIAAAATAQLGAPGAPVSPAATRAPAARSATPFVADHAVSIVLYLGAFLVVAAVIIFLAYSWEDLSGGARLTILALLTGSFLGAAAICLPRPSVRPAGRTFLALGAMLIPANVAAVYLVYFWDSPIPPAVFWLLGALISGGLHALLSVRLRSTGYAALAVPSVPVAASALGYLIHPEWAWIGTWSAAALALMLLVARYTPPMPTLLPLIQTARGFGSLLLVLAFLVTLPALSERDLGQLSPPVALALMSASLAWEATRRGNTWWIGAVAALVTAPLIAIALAVEDQRYWFVDAVMLAGWITVLTARRLEPRQRLLWDVAALGPAVLYPLAAWGDDRAAVQFFAGAVALSLFLAWAYRSPLPLFVGVLALDGAYLKLLDIFGSPDSPTWALGVALWPLALIWTVAGLVVPRRWGGPGWLGAALTMLAAALITLDEPRWNLAITASAALATTLAAWRLRLAVILPFAAVWLVLAGVQAGELLQLERPWRFVVAGLTGWLLFAVVALRPSGLLETRPRPAGPPQLGEPAGADTPPTVEASSAAAPADSTNAPAPSRSGTLLPSFGPSTIGEWALAPRIGALGAAGLAILLLFTAIPTPRAARDIWLLASMFAWLNAVALLATWALVVRSWSIALGAALSVVPSMLSGIARLHPDEAQLYAAPVGVYLLAVAWVARSRRQPLVGSVIAAGGLVVLLGTSVLQSFDRDGGRYALLALVQGLVLVGIGIAVRWRVLVIGGVAGTVVIVLRQLFDTISGLPWWAILGGSGILLLGSAVALLLIRARLAAAGRAVADRWSSWD